MNDNRGIINSSNVYTQKLSTNSAVKEVVKESYIEIIEYDVFDGRLEQNNWYGQRLIHQNSKN